jgi:hypothetical protein
LVARLGAWLAVMDLDCSSGAGFDQHHHGAVTPSALSGTDDVAHNCCPQ